MDHDTVLHNSVSLLSRLSQRFGENNVDLCVSLKDCEIPDKIDEIYIKNQNDYKLKEVKIC